MARCVCFLSLTLLFLSAAGASDEQSNPPAGSVTIVQPGAPGQSSKMLTPATAVTAPRAPAEADVSFMQGMIMHHSQAVEMTDLMRTRTRNKKLQALGKRISISQTDEIKYMQQWLEDRGKPKSMGHGNMDHSAGMKGMHDMKGMADMEMGSMPLMPGMLTPQQMKALAKASGATFDHLFLTGMIQHHTGALVMVEDLFDTPGAGQDNVLFDFATDIDNTQRAEIKIMQGMLKEKQ
jgi:uncharacterized protein (DUF305 family)